jgi:hypothetical protein
VIALLKCVDSLNIGFAIKISCARALTKLSTTCLSAMSSPQTSASRGSIRKAPPTFDAGSASLTLFLQSKDKLYKNKSQIIHNVGIRPDISFCLQHESLRCHHRSRGVTLCSIRIHRKSDPEAQAYEQYETGKKAEK